MILSMESNTQRELFNFIEAAEKSRKYPPATADGLKAAFRLFEKVLNDDEKNSLETFRNNINQIYSEVVRQNLGKNFTAASLETYNKRLHRLLRDYMSYGLDPTKMAHWEPKVREIRNKKLTAPIKEGIETLSDSSQMDDVFSGAINTINGIKHEVILGNNRKATLIYPSDLKQKEADRLKKYIEIDTNPGDEEGKR